MKTYFLFMFLLVLFTPIKAQTLPVVTPSPEAAGLGSIAKLPVNYHTGQVNIEIPLLEVEQDGFKLPIKLTYNTTGIQINNRNTWVGINWTLDAGGAITRTVKGNPDESEKSSFWIVGGVLNNEEWYNTSFLIDKVYKPNNNLIFSLEPDEFNFKAPGISGTFYIGNDKKVYVVGQPGTKVIMDRDAVTLNSPWNISITALNGIKYSFLPDERSVFTEGHSEGDLGIISSWLLHSITLPKSNEIINFKYSGIVTSNICYTREIEIHTSYKRQNNSWQRAEVGCSNIPRVKQELTLKHCYLDSIKGRNFNITFKRSPKEYFDTWSQLKEITLTRNSDTKNLKKIGFEYSNSDSKSRFWLNSISISGQNDNDIIPPYHFAYYPYDGLSRNYDCENNFPTDHWGYLRGLNTAAPIPTLIKEGNDVYYSKGKDSNPNDIIKGMLKQITYPTGGKIELIYESNDYSKFGETRQGTELKIREVQKVMNESSQLIASKKDLGGGLRIKELNYWDNNKQAASYQYKYIANYNPGNGYDNDKNIVSSGILGNMPVYHYSLNINNYTDAPFQLLCDATASQPFSEISLTQGVVVGYSEVTEIEHNRLSGLKGYTKYRYSNFDTDPDIKPLNLSTALNVCINANTSRNTDRGLLLSKEIYDNKFTLKDKVDYSYSVEHTNNIRAAQVTSLGGDACANLSGSALSAYYVPLDTPNLIEEKETIYENNTANGLTKTIKYSYNDKKQTKEIRMSMNDGKTWHCKRFYYPNDFTSNPTYQNMVDKNIISPIVMQEEMMIDANNKSMN